MQLPSVGEWQNGGHHFRFNGHKIFYHDDPAQADEPQGNILFIHGFPTASWDWCKLWPALNAGYRLIAPDMLGFGFSAKPRGHRYTLVEQADLHVALLETLGVTKTHVLAHDYGDSVAQELLARHNEGSLPWHMQSLCLLNGGLFPETHLARPVQKALHTPLGPVLARLMSRRSFDKNLCAVFGANSQPSSAELEAFWTLFSRENGKLNVHRLIRYMAERREHRARWVSALQQAPLPLRVIDGAADPVSGAHMVARFRELVPNPDTVLLEGIGHYPQTEDPAGVLAAYQAFLNNIKH